MLGTFPESKNPKGRGTDSRGQGVGAIHLRGIALHTGLGKTLPTTAERVVSRARKEWRMG
jgi:hypothetical protein